MSSTVAVAASVMMAGAVVAVVVAVVAGSRRRHQSQQPVQQQPAQPQPKPVGGKPGKSLGADCKITGDVFADRAAKPGGISQTNVHSTYHYYAPHYDTGTLACADVFWKWDDYSAKLLRYPWFAYCLGGRDTWNPAKVCGRCFRVTNRATGASIIGRAVDSGGCPGGTQSGIDADPCLFNAIDTDRAGVRDGHMKVDVQEVEC